MDAYLHEPSCYDGRLPYLSIIVNLVVLSKYLRYLQEQESNYHTDAVAIQEQALPKRKRKVQILIQPRLWAKAILSSPR